jgi:hypothetical protein
MPNNYQKFAEVIRDALDRVNHAEHAHLIEVFEASTARHLIFVIRNNLANVLAEDNPGFNFVKFANACTPPTNPNPDTN